MKIFKCFLLFNFLFFVLIAFTTPAYALTLQPGDKLWDSTDDPNGVSDTVYPVWANNNQTEIEASLLERSIDITAGALYKNEITSEEGIFAGNYDAKDWVGDPGSESGVTIWHTGGSYIADADFLLVKDGAHIPSWYLFSLDGWNGTEAIVLENFWVDATTGVNLQGGISHVSIYGATPVPEPATMALFGLGLIGLAGIGRKTKK